ncbi:PadR family transcriptional regulator [Peribacillus frigoritolerans]|uniref:PadR family transcriptional regulator n=1 Tax=Peribacillus frigoritolerans TaxID=450367 RepID=UPI00207AE991|nr:PadR family transcriptional regulator [Peribacillus frigoritolerans]USK79178.1 PadR family transcriptional regulator [Peribacillus frigoritolerans]WJE46480.1 PadR family transcriptional regulator [Peribacillus frigoritolerans]
MDKELMKGSIDLLLLSLLSQKQLYGYEITKILKQMSKGNYEISEGTLYPALKRLEKKEFIKGHWKESESGRRKYYHVTENGQTELERKRECFFFLEKLVRKSAEQF